MRVIGHDNVSGCLTLIEAAMITRDGALLVVYSTAGQMVELMLTGEPVLDALIDDVLIRRMTHASVIEVSELINTARKRLDRNQQEVS